MDIAGCTFSLIFNPIPDIRRSLFKIEDCLEGYVKPFQLVPLPENAPLDLPRITATSEKKHSELLVTAQSAQVRTSFDEEYLHDIEKSLTYSQKKAEELLAALTTMDDVALMYAGLSTQIVFRQEDITDEPASFIKNSYLKIDSDMQLFDASAKIGYKVGDDCFLNLEVSRQFEVSPISINVSPNSIAVNMGNPNPNQFLSIVVDFNNRLAFNEGHAAGCDHSTIEMLYSKIRDFASSGINAFLEGKVKF